MFQSRFEDRGLTLRLFIDKSDALAYPGAKDPMRYATGWIAKNESGQWIDGDGTFPSFWKPDPDLIGGVRDPSMDGLAFVMPSRR